MDEKKELQTETRLSLLEQRLTVVEKQVINITDMKLSLQHINDLMENQQNILTEVRDSTKAQHQTNIEQQVVITDILKSMKLIESLSTKVNAIEKKVDVLENTIETKKENKKYVWGFWTAVAVGVLGIVGSILGIVL